MSEIFHRSWGKKKKKKSRQNLLCFIIIIIIILQSQKQIYMYGSLQIAVLFSPDLYLTHAEVHLRGYSYTQNVVYWHDDAQNFVRRQSIEIH